MSSEGNQAVDQPPQRAARSKAHETLTKLSKLDLLKMLKSLRAQLAQKSEVLALTTENLCEQASIQDELKKEIRHLQEQLQSRRHEDSEAKDDEIQRLKVRLDASQRLAQKRATEVEELREKLRVLRPKLQQQQRQLSEARNDASVALERLKTAHEAQVQAQETASKSQRELRQLESAVAARVAAEQRRLQEIRTQLQHQVAASTQQHEADTARWRDTERDLRSRVQQLEQENAQLREDIESGAAEDRRFNKLCEVQARLGGALFDRSEREARVAELEMRCRQLLLRDKAHRRRTKRLQAQLELLQGGKDADSGGSSSSDDTGVVGGTPSDLRYVRNVFVKFLQLTPLSPPQQQLLPLLASLLHFNDDDRDVVTDAWRRHRAERAAAETSGVMATALSLFTSGAVVGTDDVIFPPSKPSTPATPVLSEPTTKDLEAARDEMRRRRQQRNRLSVAENDGNAN